MLLRALAPAATQLSFDDAADMLVPSQPHCVCVPGTEGPEEGPANGSPQVRAASGPPHQERLGGSLQSRLAAAPGRALAPRGRRLLASGFCRKLTFCAIRISYTHSQSFLRPRPVGNNALPPQLEIRSSNNGDPQTGQSWGPPVASRHRPK